MRDILRSLRTQYFYDVADLVPHEKIQSVVVTHILDDRPELLAAINNAASITLLIAIPYSVHQETFNELKEKYNVVSPTLDQLKNSQYLKELLIQHIDPNAPFIISEIGGYFAPAIEDIHHHFGDKLLGVIEDTETGHRLYDKVMEQLPCPVISVARSSLKETEDFLVGASCVYSTERILRTAGFPMGGKPSLVMGFGKVGKGVTAALAKRHCPVTVYDTNPTLCINALSYGYSAPNRTEAFKRAEVIYGATGCCSICVDDLSKLKHGAMLVSCSSKDIEFDLEALKQGYNKTTIFPNFDRYEKDNQVIYLVADGRPVNFTDGAVIGPVLSLVQSEIIISIKTILQYQGNAGLFENDEEARQLLAHKWMHYFCDDYYGCYKHA